MPVKITELDLCPALLLVFTYRMDRVPMRELVKTYESCVKNLLNRPCVPDLRKVFASIHGLPRETV